MIQQGLMEYSKYTTNFKGTIIQFQKTFDNYFKTKAKLSHSSISNFYDHFISNLQSISNHQQQNAIQLFGYFELNKIITKSHLCAKRVIRNEKVFQCKNCMNSHNAILCVKCFEEGNHQGHIYEVIYAFGGCCDCGDEQMWNKDGFCKNHRQQNNKVEVDQTIKITYITQMQFCIQILFCLFKIESSLISPQNYKHSLSNKYGSILIETLISFNKNSLISNRMTAELLLSQINHQQQSLQIISKLFDLYPLSSVAQAVTNLYIIIFTVKQFKLKLTQQFILKFNQYSDSFLFLQSPYYSLICQLLSFYQTINKLLDQGRIKPLQFHPKNKNLRSICKSPTFYYHSYYYAIQLLSNLKQGVGEKYLKFHTEKSSIVNLSLYRLIVEQNPSAFITNYKIQAQYMDKVIPILKILRNQKDTLKKIIKDLYQFLANHNLQKQHYSIYNPHEKTLAITIYVYIQGNIHSLANSHTMEELLKIMGVNQNWKIEIANIINKINYVLLCECKILSNSQKMNQYNEFYQCNFKHNKIIPNTLYMLMVILNHMIQYLSNNHQSIGNYLQINNIINNLIISHNLDINHKIKMVKTIATLVSLNVEIASSKYSQMLISCAVQLKNQQSIMQFYQALLSNYQNLPFKEFKTIKNNYSKQQQIFQLFVTNMTSIVNGRIILKQQYKINPLCPYYFQTSKNLNNNIIQKEKILLSQNPSYINKIYIIDFFTKDIISNLTNLVDYYIQQILLTNHKDSKSIFNDLVFQIIKLNLLIKETDQTLNNYLIIISQESNVWDVLNQDNKKYLINNKQSLKNENIEIQLIKKKKMLEIKNKKIQQMRNKINKVSKKLNQQLQNNFINNNKQSQDCCMICKQTQLKGTLIFLCLIQKSNLHNKLMKKQSKAKLIFSSCYHNIHLKCFQKTYGSQHQIKCILCKTVSNAYLPIFNHTNNFIDWENSFQRIKFINEIFALKRQEYEQINQQKSQNIALREIIDGLISQIVRLGFGFPQELLKKKRKIYNSIFYLVSNVIKIRSLQNQFYKKLSQTNQNLKKILQEKHDINEVQYFQKFTYIILLELILQHVQLKVQIPINYENDYINTKKVLNIKYLINCILQTNIIPQQLTYLNNQQFKNDKKNKIYKIPKQLKNLRKQIGKCHNCNHITNHISICFICKWKGCQGCQKMKLSQHTIEQHQGKSLFIKVDTGQIYYIFQYKGLKINSIYQNPMEEPYKKCNNIQKYTLNEKKYQNHVIKILFDQIQPIVRYQDIVNNSQIFDVSKL